MSTRERLKVVVVIVIIGTASGILMWVWPELEGVVMGAATVVSAAAAVATPQRPE